MIDMSYWRDPEKIEEVHDRALYWTVFFRTSSYGIIIRTEKELFIEKPMISTILRCNTSPKPDFPDDLDLPA